MSLANTPAYAGHLAEPSVPGTASEENDARQTSLPKLIREGLLAILIAFAVTAPQSIMLGSTQAVRRGIVIEGFLVMLLGGFFAGTLAGRVFLALSYLVFYERNYFEPPTAWVVTFAPSTFLIVLAVVLESLRPGRRTLLSVGAAHLRTPLFVLTALLYGGLLLAASFSPVGLTESLRTTLDNYVPLLLFALAGAMILRRGAAGVFLDLLPFLASIVALTVWIYYITGERVLFYEDIFRYHEEWARFGGMLRNANNTAFLCAACTLVIFTRIHRAPRYLQIIMLANALYLTGTIVLVRTRGALVVMAVVLPFLFMNRRARGALLLFIGLGIAGAVLGRGILSTSRVGNEDQESVVERFRTTGGGLQLRMRSYLDALRTASEHPFGIGMVGGVISGDIESGTGLESHNEYIGFLTKNGVQSVFALVLLVGIVTAGWVTAVRQKMPHRPGPALKTLVVSYALTFTFEPIQGNSYQLTGLFGIVVGLVTASILFAYPQTPSDVPLRGDRLPSGGAAAPFAPARRPPIPERKGTGPP